MPARRRRKSHGFVRIVLITQKNPPSLTHMTKFLPIFLILALAACSDLPALFWSQPGGTPEAQTGSDASGDADSASDAGGDDSGGGSASTDVAAEPGILVAPPPSSAEAPPRTEGDPFNAPRQGTSEPARTVIANTGDGIAAPVPAPTSDGRLGTTTASLGDPNEPGFWVKTPLVTSPQSGRVVYVNSGRSVQVQLIPAGSAGGGSQISVAAMRLLEAPLTGLPELVVYNN